MIGAVHTNALTAEQVDEARKVATAFRQRLPILGVPGEKHSEAQEVIAELEDEAASREPKQNLIKNLLYKYWSLLHLAPLAVRLMRSVL